MNLLLEFMTVCVVVGLVSSRLRGREQTITTLLAVLITALYFFQSRRFM